MIFFQRSAVARCTAMPPPSESLSEREIEVREPRRVHEPVEERVHAGDRAERVLAQLLHEPRHVARVGDEDVVGADLHVAEAAAGEREDVVHRQRRDRDLLAVHELAADPRRDLLQVRDEVAVGEHRALGDAGGAAGVLQESQVLVADRRLGERVAAPLGERGVEGGRRRRASTAAPGASRASPRRSPASTWASPAGRPAAW